MNEVSPAVPDPAQHFQLWADVLAQVLGEVTGSAFPCQWVSSAPEQLPPASETDLWVVAVCDGTVRGELSVRIPAGTVLRLAQAFMGEPGNAEVEVTAEYREAVTELLRQVGGLIATALKAAHGEVQLRLEVSGGAPTWTPSATGWINAGPEQAVTLEVQLSPALVASLRVEPREFEEPALPPPSPSVPHDERVNLGLLMDVELAVTLRFGSRRLLLREILDINPGSVIGLDRQVQEPADMLLDGRVIARGEVVVVDGNYGFRVTEVGSEG